MYRHKHTAWPLLKKICLLRKEFKKFKLYTFHVQRGQIKITLQTFAFFDCTESGAHSYVVSSPRFRPNFRPALHLRRNADRLGRFRFGPTGSPAAMCTASRCTQLGNVQLQVPSCTKFTHMYLL